MSSLVMDIKSILLILFLVFLFSTQNVMFSLGMICKENERKALLSIKQDLKDNHYGLSSWSGENCCRWAGVGCDNITDHVVELLLQGPWLEGKLNPSLQELKQLRHLDLSFNKFEGSIPNFLGSFQSLEYLKLSRAGFSGVIPHQLGNLSNLRYLDVRYDDTHHEGLSTVDGNYEGLSTVDGNYEGLITVGGNYKWLSHLYSLQHLNMSGVNLQDASNCLQAISMLPSLLSLHLSDCALDALPSLSYVNFTSLVVLDLSQNNLNSILPEWLYKLTNLEQLDLYENSFQGTISSSIGNLTRLTLLDLSFNHFEGGIPMTLGNLSKLQSLYLSSNQLSGPISDELGRLVNLNSLHLKNNSFSGSIPLSIGRLSLLKELDLGHNKLNGSLPQSFGNLSKLVTLYISQNLLEGVVSEVHFANLTNLQYLSMGLQVLKMSPEWVPPFQLLYANLRSCKLGPGFPIWLRTQKNLEYLDLSRTGISGTIPTWFWNVMSSLDFFNFYDLSHNELNGKLPKRLNISINLSSNKFNGQLPLVNPFVYQLDLSNNSFSGPISTFLCQPLSETYSLEILHLSNNHLSGVLSDCWINWTNLKSLRLGGNNIMGKIPSSIGSLLELQALDLSRNSLSGELPSSLRNCKYLTSINLGENRFTGIIPTWLGEFSSLIILLLRSNKFYNEIPLELCHLDSIRVLDIAHNDLQGSIPTCFSEFTAIATKRVSFVSVMTTYVREAYEDTTAKSAKYTRDAYEGTTTNLVMKGRELEYDSFVLRFFTYLDLSKNNLSGEIPEELTKLRGLQSLNLSENRFTGKIFENISSMGSLESLDLSKNQISGVIPQSILGLHFLSYLNLSYNNLSGKIPLGTQMQSFNESSYVGNTELCGLPLIKYCNGEEPRDKGIEDEDWFEMKWFYTSMEVGLAVGFWVFWSVIVFKMSWRIAYFRFLDNKEDKLCLLF